MFRWNLHSLSCISIGIYRPFNTSQSQKNPHMVTVVATDGMTLWLLEVLCRPPRSSDPIHLLRRGTSYRGGQGRLAVWLPSKSLFYGSFEKGYRKMILGKFEWLHCDGNYYPKLHHYVTIIPHWWVNLIVNPGKMILCPPQSSSKVLPFGNTRGDRSTAL